MTKEALIKLGNSLIGKTGQSRLLTEISPEGRKVMSDPQKITGFEIVESFKEADLMLTIGGENIYADLVINIK